MLNAALFTSNSEDWTTPQSLFDEISAEYKFTCDVAASAANAKCPTFYDKQSDGLSQLWGGYVGVIPLTDAILSNG